MCRQVRDAQGRKMSKSLGNVVDPLDAIGEYGADALRYTLATGEGRRTICCCCCCCCCLNLFVSLYYGICLISAWLAYGGECTHHMAGVCVREMLRRT